jgi:hypothetical protein
LKSLLLLVGAATITTRDAYDVSNVDGKSLWRWGYGHTLLLLLLDGPVEVVAPDGSLLTLAQTWTRPVTSHEGVRYTAPGTYTYGRHRLVPIAGQAP